MKKLTAGIVMMALAFSLASGAFAEKTDNCKCDTCKCGECKC